MERDQRLEALTGALQGELRQYGDLLEASRQHQEALLSGETGKVEKCLQMQMTSLEGCRRNTAIRQELTTDLAQELGLGQPCTTGRLMAMLPGGGGEKLRRIYKDLKSLTDQLISSNQGNQRLSEHRLDLLQGDFKAMHELVSRNLKNKPDGEKVEGSLLSIKA
jgi:hypothetical protein